MFAMPSSHKLCGKSDCMLCDFNIMYAYFNLMNASSSSFISDSKGMTKKHDRAKTASPPKVRKGTHVSKTKDKFVKAEATEKKSVDEEAKNVKHVTPVKSYKQPGPK